MSRRDCSPERAIKNKPISLNRVDTCTLLQQKSSDMKSCGRPSVQTISAKQFKGELQSCDSRLLRGKHSIGASYYVSYASGLTQTLFWCSNFQRDKKLLTMSWLLTSRIRRVLSLLSGPLIMLAPLLQFPHIF